MRTLMRTAGDSLQGLVCFLQLFRLRGKQMCIRDSTCEGGHRYDDAVRRLAAAAQAEKEAAGHRGAGASPRVAASA